MRKRLKFTQNFIYTKPQTIVFSVITRIIYDEGQKLKGSIYRLFLHSL